MIVNMERRNSSFIKMVNGVWMNRRKWDSGSTYTVTKNLHLNLLLSHNYLSVITWKERGLTTRRSLTPPTPSLPPSEGPAPTRLSVTTRLSRPRTAVPTQTPLWLANPESKGPLTCFFTYIFYLLNCHFVYLFCSVWLNQDLVRHRKVNQSPSFHKFYRSSMISFLRPTGTETHHSE